MDSRDGLVRSFEFALIGVAASLGTYAWLLQAAIASWVEAAVVGEFGNHARSRSLAVVGFLNVRFDSLQPFVLPAVVVVLIGGAVLVARLRSGRPAAHVVRFACACTFGGCIALTALVVFGILVSG